MIMLEFEIDIIHDRGDLKKCLNFSLAACQWLKKKNESSWQNKKYTESVRCFNSRLRYLSLDSMVQKEV